MDDTSTLTAEINASACFMDCSLLAEKDAELEKLHAELEQAKAEKASLASEHEKLQKKYQRTKAAAATYKHMLFGQSSEKSSFEEEHTVPEEKQTDKDSPGKTTPKSNRKRGAKPEHKGHGRKIPENLPVIYRIIEVPEEERSCPICGRDCKEVSLTEDACEIDGDMLCPFSAPLPGTCRNK